MGEDSREAAVAVLASGGLDSAVLCAELARTCRQVHPIYVRFGLRWETVEQACLERFLDAVRPERPALRPLTVFDEPIAAIYGSHWSTAGPAIVPGYESPDEAVYLPGRNVLLAAKAAVWCRVRDIERLAFGVLRANPFPDSTPGFFTDLAAVLNRAMDGRLGIIRPFEHLSKFDVVERGRGLPLHLTFSCLNPHDGRHCGDCNKCAERRRGFERAGITDLTEYAVTPATP